MRHLPSNVLYPVDRRVFPRWLWRIFCCSVGLLLLFSMCTWKEAPGLQNPHCSPWHSATHSAPDESLHLAKPLPLVIPAIGHRRNTCKILPPCGHSDTCQRRSTSVRNPDVRSRQGSSFPGKKYHAFAARPTPRGLSIHPQRAPCHLTARHIRSLRRDAFVVPARASPRSNSALPNAASSSSRLLISPSLAVRRCGSRRLPAQASGQAR